MSIKLYRVRIEGYVVHQDFGGSGPQLTPIDWGLEAIVTEMDVNVHITETRWTQSKTRLKRGRSNAE